jgi:hypothetical protein
MLEYLCTVKIESWIALAAIVVAIITVVVSNYNARQLVRNGKLEELVSLLDDLSTMYLKFHTLLGFKDDPNSNPHKFKELLDKENSMTEFLPTIKKLNRLKVLSKIYPSKGINFEVIELKDEFVELMTYVSRKENKGGVFRSSKNYSNSINVIIERVISEIHLNSWYIHMWRKK